MFALFFLISPFKRRAPVGSPFIEDALQQGAKLKDSLIGAPLKIIIGKYKKNAQTSFCLYGTWEALDSSEWVVFDAGVFLDTLATHSENLFFPTFFDAFPTPKTILEFCT